MTEKETHPTRAEDLRRKAEEVDRATAAPSPEELPAMSSDETRQALHELRVHQIELEMQNSELRSKQEELDAARARYFGLYELAPVGYVTISKQGLLIEANLTAATMLGMVRGVPGHVHPIFSHFIHINDQDIYYRFRKQLLETGKPQACELRMVKKDGSLFWANLEATVAEDPATGSGQAGEPVICVVISDITAGQNLKSANLLLEASRVAESIVETVREPLLVLDAELKIISANQSFYRTFQVTPAETIGSFIYDLGNKQWDIPTLRELLETILPEKATFDNYEVEHDFATIGKRTMLLNARQIQRLLGKEKIILLAIEDITERKLKEAQNLLEQMVEERTKQLRQQTEAPPAEGDDTILLVDDEPHVLSALTRTLRNSPYQLLTAENAREALEIMETTSIKVIVSDEQMPGMRGAELLAEVKRRFPHTMRILLTGQATLEASMRAVNEGQIYRFLTKPWDDAVLRLALSAATDRYNFDAEKRRLQDDLRQSEKRFRDLAELLPETVFEADLQGTLTFANKNAFDRFGYTQEDFAGGLNLLDTVMGHERDRTLENIQRVMNQENIGSNEYTVQRKDGNTFPATIHTVAIIQDGKPVGLRGLVTDITNLKQAEAEKEKLEIQNRQLQKSESLGRMAAAIAHHFNNQLGVVIGNLEMAMDDLPRDAEPFDTLNSAMEGAGKAAQMSGLMLTFLGQTSEKREPLDIAEACLRNKLIIQTVVPANVVMETALPSPGPVISANANQIQQIMTNLVTNACESIGDNHGTISLNVRTFTPAEIPAVHRYPGDWQPKDKVYACLEVKDTGCGIEDKDIEKVFDPFFTTKFTGRGMGLAAVMGIVKAHGGVITVESEPGRGSTFQVFFPVSGEEVPRQPDKALRHLAIEKGSTVLLVEDDAMVREMAAAMLKHLGFAVIEAKDGVEAVEMFRQRQNEIHFVISDLTMPRMDGWETLTALRKIKPGLPVIIASGYDKAHVMSGDHPELPQVFLGKPFKLKGLSDAISEALTSENN